MTEADLLRKLAAIEALLRGATSRGEREAAVNVKETLAARLAATAAESCADHKFSLPDPWGRQLFIAMAAKMGLNAFRYRGQRRTTLIVHGKESVVLGVLWKQYLEGHAVLDGYLREVTDRVIREAVGVGADEAAEQAQLPPGGSED